MPTIQLTAHSTAVAPKGMTKGNLRSKLELLQRSEARKASQVVQGSATRPPKQGPRIDPSAQHDIVIPKTRGCETPRLVSSTFYKVIGWYSGCLEIEYANAS